MDLVRRLRIFFSITSFNKKKLKVLFMIARHICVHVKDHVGVALLAILCVAQETRI